MHALSMKDVHKLLVYLNNWLFYSTYTSITSLYFYPGHSNLIRTVYLQIRREYGKLLIKWVIFPDNSTLHTILLFTLSCLDVTADKRFGKFSYSVGQRDINWSEEQCRIVVTGHWIVSETWSSTDFHVWQWSTQV